MTHLSPQEPILDGTESFNVMMAKIQDAMPEIGKEELLQVVEIAWLKSHGKTTTEIAEFLQDGFNSVDNQL